VGWLVFWSGVALVAVGGVVRLSYEPAVQEYNDNPSESRELVLYNYIEARDDVVTFFVATGLISAGTGGILILTSDPTPAQTATELRLHITPSAFMLESRF
jgi:hypothetical protein